MIFTAADVNLRHLGTVTASYEPKGILTEAIQATPENIGKIALEFELELFYTETGFPFFRFYAVREEDESPNSRRQLTVRPGDWIVPLWGELHAYHDIQFRNTFAFVLEVPVAAHEAMPSYVPREQVAEAIRSAVDGRDADFNVPLSGELTGPEGTQIIPSPSPRIPGIFESLGKVKVTEDENGLNVEKA